MWPTNMEYLNHVNIHYDKKNKENYLIIMISIIFMLY
jgi:hypothetical protein